MKNLKLKIALVLAVVLASLYLTFPLEKRVNLGLDLKGGMHLVLKVETEKLSDNAKQDAVIRAMEILRNRIDSMGVGETVIQRQGENQIIVQLPGVTDRDTALAMIGRVALLEFKLVNSDPIILKNALAGDVPKGYELKNMKDEASQPILLEEKPILTGEAIKDARVDFDRSGFGEPKISLTLNGRGTKDFADITQKHTGERLAIVLDGEVLSAPNIREPILSGTAEISGMFKFEEASLLALALRSGSLPAPMHVEEERTIGPLLGKDSIHAGVKACVIGAASVFIFMTIYYLLSGLIADIALVINMLMIIGTMSLLNILMPGSQVTLTLPGIAGIILTLGMAVDANVLINERIREELENARPLNVAINTGFNRAFAAIFDSHITSLIASFILYQFGSGPIKGFAVTLAIGIIVSLFTAVTVTKTILDLLIQLKVVKTLPMLHIFHNPKLDFISGRFMFFTLSVILTIASIATIIVKKEAAYGIDFTGGQIQEYKFEKAVSSEDLRQHLKEAQIADVVIQQFEKSPEIVMLRSNEDTFNKVVEVFKTKMPDNKFEVMRIEKVGPVVGQNLRTRALWAIVLSLAGILIYIGFRFKHFDFAAAGVIALLHDVLMAAGITVMLGHQIDLLVVTALLTIAGYSISDTIVTYDRVRENLIKIRNKSLAEIINLSINQTLGRTILTTGVTLLSVIALFLFGGSVLHTFALCLLIGFSCGAYSTIFIASPLVLAWQKKK